MGCILNLIMSRSFQFFALVLFTVNLAFGQNISGTITGTVDDPAAARVMGAAVEAVNQDTGVRYHSSTNDAGIYVIPELPLGTYTVTVESRGFKTFVRSKLELGADSRLRVDAVLELGNKARHPGRQFPPGPHQ